MSCTHWILVINIPPKLHESLSKAHLSRCVHQYIFPPTSMFSISLQPLL